MAQPVVPCANFAPDIAYLRKEVFSADTEEGFFDYLRTLNCSRIVFKAMAEVGSKTWYSCCETYGLETPSPSLRPLCRRQGSTVFPRTPLITLDGPLALLQVVYGNGVYLLAG